MTEEHIPWTAEYAEHLLPVFGTPAAELDHGQGAWVYDVDGRRYLDFLAGIAVSALGHAHPALVRAIAEQAARVIHVSNLFTSPAQIGLAEDLLRIAGDPEDGRVFFCNSGTEANEGAFKIARAHEHDGGGSRILALDHAFHGRTMGALSVTWKERLRERFEPLAADVEFIPATVAALEAAMDDEVAAVFLEPIQGEAGVLPLPEGFLEAARRLTREHDALMIVDEVQTGMGRTGTWFAFQRAGVMPDVFTLAKGLGGGVPIGATVTTGRASGILHAGDHGSTFGGNPLATSAGRAVIGAIESEHLLDNVARRSAELRELLAGLPLVADVRGQGLLLGVRLERSVAPRLVTAALAVGLIINAPDEQTIRLAPPLVIGEPEVAEFGERWTAACRSLDRQSDDTERQDA